MPLSVTAVRRRGGGFGRPQSRPAANRPCGARPRRLPRRAVRPPSAPRRKRPTAAARSRRRPRPSAATWLPPRGAPRPGTDAGVPARGRGSAGTSGYRADRGSSAARPAAIRPAPRRLPARPPRARACSTVSDTSVPIAHDLRVTAWRSSSGTAASLRPLARRRFSRPPPRAIRPHPPNEAPAPSASARKRRRLATNIVWFSGSNIRLRHYRRFCWGRFGNRTCDRTAPASWQVGKSHE